MSGQNGTVGEYIKARREALGLTQEQLGDVIGRDQTFVSQMERNRTDGYLPERGMLRQIAAALRLTMEDLLSAAGYLGMADDPRPPRPLDNPKVLFMTEKMGRLTPRQIDALNTIIEEFLDGEP